MHAPTRFVLSLSLTICFVAKLSSAVFVDDSFSDGGITNGSDPLDTAWTKLSANGAVGAIAFDTTGNASTAFRFDPGVSNWGIAKGGNFTSSALSVGQSLVLSFNFRLANSGALAANASALRFGLGSSSQSFAFVFGVAANGGALVEYPVDVVSGTSTNLGAAGTLFNINDKLPHVFTLTLTRTAANVLGLSGNVDGSHVFTASRSGVSNFTFDRILVGEGNSANVFHIDNVLVSSSTGSTQTNIITDTFSDGGRTDGADASDISWFALGAPTLAVIDDTGGIATGNVLRQTSSGLYQGLLGNAPWYHLGDGDSLTLSFDWRFTATTGLNQAAKLRFGMHYSGGSLAYADSSFTSNDSGYFSSTNPGSANSAGTSLLREPAGDGILSGANNTVIGSAGASVNSGTTKHTASMTLRRSGTSLICSTSIDGLAAASGTDSTPTSYHFDEINAMLVGSTTAPPYLMDNVKLDFTTVNPTPPSEGPPSGTWNLVLDEQFNGTSLNTAVWSTGYRWADIINNELQGMRPENVTVANGVCTIKTEKRICKNRNMYGYEWGNTNPDSPTFAYASGTIQTYDKWTSTYGYFEARLKMPAGKGTWPAFWLLPDRGAASGDQYYRSAVGSTVTYPSGNTASCPMGNEIDIFEHMGSWKNPTTGISKLHCGYFASYKSGSSGEYMHKNGVVGNYILSNPDTQFHNYGLYWAPGQLVFYIDGQVAARRDNRTNVGVCPHYVIFNTALSTDDWTGTPVPKADIDATLPSYMVIDYFRVYSGTPSPAP